MGRLTVRCLGSLEVAIDGRPVTLTTGRLRTLLVVLALSAGRTVSFERLVETVCGEDPVMDVRATLQTYKSRLRRLLGPEWVEVTPSGYALNVEPDDVDVLRFDRLLDLAERTSDPERERELLAEATGLWRGTPFGDVRSEWLAQAEAPRLTERYLRAVERLADLGGGDLATLERLASEHPLRESLWSRLIAALGRYGRTAEALERYETIRVRITTELGVDPGGGLREIHSGLGGRRVVPRQLPPDLPGFVGREPALARLDESSGVVTVSGTAGVGKTALAVHWAHRAIGRFPDGQLYVDLRGFDPSARAMTSAEALRGFLDGLEVPPKRIPSAPEEQEELYRRLVAGKRMLVLLDNARDEEQIGPLLPRSPGCLAIVTSRNRLAGSYDLDLLSREESRELLVRRVGDDDVDTGSVERVVDACSRLPLALAVVAARAVCSGTGLAAVAAELAETGDTLDLLAGNDALTDIRAAFSWSYHALGDDAARLFRLLGLHPGPDITVAAAVSLAGAPQVFEELSQAHLVIEHKPGRYAIHDLLRVYAKELVQDDRDAVHRMLDHYVHSARDASQLITGPRQPFAIAPPRPGVVPEVVGDYRQAMDWFGAEHAVLRGLFDVAASMGFDEHVGALAWALAPYLDRRAYWSEWVAVQQAAVAAAERRGDAVAEARAERMLGHAYVRLRRYGQAEKHCRASLDLFRAVGDEDGEAWAHHMAGYLHAEQGRWQESMDHHGQALVLLRRLGHRSGEATQLTEIGRAHSKLGDHREAVVCCRQALDVFTGDEDETGAANAWVTLGQAYLELGQRRRAIACHERAVGIYRDTGNRYREGLALLDLGDALKDPERARDEWQRALAIFEDLEHPYADRARTRLGRTAIMG